MRKSVLVGIFALFFISCGEDATPVLTNGDVGFPPEVSPYLDVITDIPDAADMADLQPDEIGEDVKPDEVGEDVLPDEVGEDVLPDEVGGDIPPDEIGGDVQPDEVGGDVLPDEVGEDIQPDEVGEDIQPDEVGEDVQPDEVGEDIQPDEIGEDVSQDVLVDFICNLVGATVQEGGEVVCAETPCNGVAQAPGSHTYEFSGNNHEPQTVVHEVSAGNATVHADLRVLVDFICSPFGAMVTDAATDEVMCAATPCYDVPMDWGSYLFECSLDGYYSQQVEKDISDADYTVDAVLEPLTPVMVQFTCTPGAALVSYIDPWGNTEVAFLQTPDEAAFYPGEYTFIFNASGYTPGVVVYMVSDIDHAVSATLEPVTAGTQVNFTSEPPAAIVSVVKQPVSATPVQIMLGPGPNLVGFSKTGYEPMEILLDVPDQASFDYHAVLEPLAQVNIMSNQSSTWVTIDEGTPDEFSDWTDFTAWLSGGWHHFKCEKTGFSTLEFDYEVIVGETTEIWCNFP